MGRINKGTETKKILSLIKSLKREGQQTRHASGLI